MKKDLATRARSGVSWSQPLTWPARTEFVINVWHHGSPRQPPFGAPSVASFSARCHRKGEPGAWYGTDTYDALLPELKRHLADDVDLRFVFRRVSRLAIRVSGLDLTDGDVRDALRVTREELTADDCVVPQLLATAARAEGFAALLVPSAAHPTARNIAVLDLAAAEVAVIEQEVITGASMEVRTRR